jgi:hypothetical protein
MKIMILNNSRDEYKPREIFLFFLFFSLIIQEIDILRKLGFEKAHKSSNF